MLRWHGGPDANGTYVAGRIDSLLDEQGHERAQVWRGQAYGDFPFGWTAYPTKEQRARGVDGRTSAARTLAQARAAARGMVETWEPRKGQTMKRSKIRKASRPRRKTTAMLRRKVRNLWAKRRAMASAKRPVSAFIAARKAQLATLDKIYARKATKPRKAKRRRKPMSAAARAAFRDRMVAARAAKRGGRLPRGNWTGYSGDEIRDMLANGDRPPRKARKPKRKSNRAPMSAAQREAFKRRMQEARARKHGGRNAPMETFHRDNLQHSTHGYYPPRAPTPSKRTGGKPIARRVQRASSPGVAGRIVEILRAAGYAAKLYVQPDRNEIVTDAPEAVCAQAAAAAGA